MILTVLAFEKGNFSSESSFVFNSQEAIADAIIGLLLVFYLFRCHDFCYHHMTSQPHQICFLFIRSYNFN